MAKTENPSNVFVFFYGCYYSKRSLMEASKKFQKSSDGKFYIVFGQLDRRVRLFNYGRRTPGRSRYMGEEFLVSTSYPGYVFVGWAAGQFVNDKGEKTPYGSCLSVLLWD